MTKKLAALLMAVLLMAALVPVTVMAASTGYRYVYTENGKTLNMRSQPQTGNNIIMRIPYAAEVYVDSVPVKGWSYVNYNGQYGYVQSRFLVESKPASKSDTTPSVTPVTTDAARILSDMNKEFAAARKVTSPYYVVSRPSRASGWVNLRWAPSTESERIATCPQGKQLLVLAELKNWYQVEDPATGMIGFISSKYVVRE